MMKFLKKYVLNNLKLKILSVFLAILFWFAVSYTGDIKMTLSVPLNLNNIPKNQIIKYIDPDHILMSISGPVSIIKNLRAKDIVVSVNLTDLKEGKNTLTLLKENVKLPNGIKLENIKPDYVSIVTDSLIEKRLKVLVRLDKKWSGIYRVKSWAPQYVLVEGSKESLNNKDTIETQIIDGNFLSDEEEIYVGLVTKDIIFKSIKPESIKVVLKRYN